MRWWQRASKRSSWILGLRALGITAAIGPQTSWTAERKLQLREDVKSLWYHGFDNYMAFAFPLDELQPISCQGRGPDWDNPSNIGLNDVNGNFSVTLIDVLDSFVVINDKAGFSKGVQDVIDNVSFNVDTKPQVFETTIRALGGLLSAHIFATNEKQFGFHLPWYKGQLLDLAKDLGERLLPAFATPTGLPYARINLRHGVSPRETTQTCSAGAGSLVLEFTTLSRLTGDDRFEKAAEKAFFAVWERRSTLGLIGNTIDVASGNWVSPTTGGIGAGIDSFYEYALKMYVFTGDERYLNVYNEAYANIMNYSLGNDRFWYRPVNPFTGEVSYTHVDSLAAFWPGLQVLGGDLEHAIKSHMIYWNLWRRYSGIPESFSILNRDAISTGYPLRPEFIESTYFLYRATRNPFYLDVGERVFKDLVKRAKVPCGLATVSNLLNNESEDRMESFALSETLKYLYLLFDEANQFNSLDDNFIFTTEGHILVLPREHHNPPKNSNQNHTDTRQCPAYQPETHGSGLIVSMEGRSDVDLARYMAGISMDGEEAKNDSTWWSPHGKCFVPKPDVYTTEFILAPAGQTAAEDTSPGLSKLVPVSDGFIVHDVTGIRLGAKTTIDGQRYLVTQLGPHKVSKEQTVYFADRSLLPSDTETASDGSKTDKPELTLHFQLSISIGDTKSSTGNELFELSITGVPASFGHNPLEPAPTSHLSPLFTRGSPPASVLRDSTNLYGCNDYEPNSVPTNTMLWVLRGECTFFEKLWNAKRAGALGVFVASTAESVIPSLDESEMDLARDELDDVTMILVATDHQKVELMLGMKEKSSTWEVLVDVVGSSRVELDLSLTEEERRKKLEDTRMTLPKRPLYINGKRLQNGILAF